MQRSVTMSKAKRRALYAEKLRNELRRRWQRELLEKQQAKARQVDPAKGTLNFGKA
jgi:post-segregation antitoxin (ccd killing protein)